MSYQAPSPHGVVFAVKLTMDGGEPGTPKTPATYTYTAMSFDGREVGKQLSPLAARPTYAVFPGTLGLVNQVGDDPVQLLFTDEQGRSVMSRL